jgi:RNA polymerase sigma-70 factor (ECF subfamily)
LLFRIFHEEFHAHSKAFDAQLELDTSASPDEGPDDPAFGLANRIAKAMALMSDNQREALILISAGGFSCEDAAAICGARPRTMKSRAARARIALFKVIESAPAKSGDVRELWAGAGV